MLHPPARKKQRQRPLSVRNIIHISGMPGSGKTTFGDRLEKELGVKRVETDLFIQHHTSYGAELSALEEQFDLNIPGSEAAYRTRWREIISSQIQRHIDDANASGVHTLVFVGILNNWGLTYDDDPPVTMPQATHRFYISIPAPVLLCQYYTRLTAKPCDDSFCSDLAVGKASIRKPKDIIEDAAKTLLWHEANGYSYKTTDEIYQRIVDIVSVDVSAAAV